jgi:hypothetical protein
MAVRGGGEGRETLRDGTSIAMRVFNVSSTNDTTQSRSPS